MGMGVAVINHLQSAPLRFHHGVTCRGHKAHSAVARSQSCPDALAEHT
jgi:hypothetical protein